MKILKGILKKNVGLFILFLLIALNSFAQTEEKYQGLLWEISGKGMKKSSYLYGTMHVSNKLAFHLSDTFFLGIKNCDIVALELNPDNWIEDMMTSPFFNEVQNMYSDYLSKNLYGTFKINSPNNKELMNILARDHNFANYLLYRISGNRENFEENTYLDLFIFQSGKKLKKQIVGLEKFEETMKMAMQAALPDEEGTNYKRYTDLLDKGADVETMLEDAYRKGDLLMLDSLSRMMSPTKNYQDYMIVKRNIIMANNMDSLLQKFSLFTGVGAAHLPGNDGVIQLLRKKGYKVRPVVNVSHKESRVMKDRIEKTIYPLSYKPQISHDSIFQVDLPGKIFYNSFGNTNEYFCPEMVNGSYYSVTKINTYAPLLGFNENYILKKVDSLLYEGIPGKILKKKEIVVNGFNGYDITSKTRRSNIERYRIIVTPMEIFIFKMGGLGDFVKTSDSDRFFNSIKLLKTNSSQWNTINSKLSNFKIEVPGQAKEEKLSGKSRKNTNLFQAYDRSRNSYFFIIKSSYHDFEYIEEDTFELTQITENFYKELNFSIKEKKFTHFGNYPSLVLKLSSPGVKDLHLKAIIKGPNYYIIGSTSSDSIINKRYFDSFTFTEYSYPNKPEIYTDTALHYTVNTLVRPKGETEFLLRMKRSIDKKKKKGKQNEKDEYLKPHSETKDFTTTNTQETILVKFEKIDAFEGYSNKDEFWNNNLEAVSDWGNLVVKSKKYEDGKKHQEMNVVLIDTNSTRAIKARMILKENRLYTLLANIDTIGKESLFVKTFFESFQPMDTLIDESIFSNKSERLFKAIEKNDSTEVAYAISSIEKITFEDKHALQLINLINDQKKLNEFGISKNKGKIIIKLGELHHEKVLPFLETTYTSALDTASLQMAVLEGLYNQKSVKAFKSIVKLLNENTPLATKSDIRWFFRELEDTLGLSKVLFPELLQFVRYPEYKENVYHLLSKLVDSNYIQPANYSSYKSSILRDAQEEFKRQQAHDEKTNLRSSSTKNYEYMVESDEDYDEESFEEYNEFFIDKGALEVYAILLMPFKQDPLVKLFFEKLDKSKNKSLKWNLTLMALKNKQFVSDTLLREFAADENFRITLLKSLNKLNKKELFDKKYLSNEAIARGIIFQGEGVEDKDSIVFITKKEVMVKGKLEDAYFFKRKAAESKSWKLSYATLLKSDSPEMTLEASIKRTGIKLPEGPKAEERILNESLKEISMTGRKRYTRDYYK